MEYQYRKINRSSKVISTDMNKNLKDIATDVQDLHINYMNDNATMVAEQLANADTLTYMQARISAIESSITAIDESKTLITAYDVGSLSYPTSVQQTGQATIYSDYGQITLPILEQVTQLMSLNEETGELTLIDDADQFVTHYLINNKYTDRVDAVFQNSVLSAFNPDVSDPFYLKSRASNTNIDFIEDVIVVTLPEAAEINTIKVLPLPEFNVTIEEIKTTTDVTQAQIKDMFAETVTFPISNSGRNIFHMPTYRTQEVMFKLRQYNYSNINGMREFRLGYRTLAIENNVYSNVGYVIVEIPSNPSYLTLQSITMDWDCDSESKVYLYDNIDDANAVTDAYLLQGTGSTVSPNAPMLLADQTHYLLVELRPINATGATPVFRGCRINRI